MEGRPHDPRAVGWWGGVLVCTKGGRTHGRQHQPPMGGGPAKAMEEEGTHGFVFPSTQHKGKGGGPTGGPDLQEDPRLKSRRTHGYGHRPGPTSAPANHRGGPTVPRTRRGEGPTVPTSAPGGPTVEKQEAHGYGHRPGPTSAPANHRGGPTVSRTRKGGGPTVPTSDRRRTHGFPYSQGRGAHGSHLGPEEDPRFPVLAREGGPRFPHLGPEEDPRLKSRRAHGYGHRPGPTGAPANHRGGPTVPRTLKGGGPTVPTSTPRRTHG